MCSGAADFGLNVAAGTPVKQAGINAGIGAVVGLATFGLVHGGKTIWRSKRGIVNRSVASDVREFSLDMQAPGEGGFAWNLTSVKKMKTTHLSFQQGNALASPISSMPPEMIDNLSKYLDNQSMKNLSQTSKYMNEALQRPLEIRKEMFHLRNQRSRAVEDAVRQVNTQRIQRIFNHRLMNRNTLARIERRLLPSGVDYIDEALEEMDLLF